MSTQSPHNFKTIYEFTIEVPREIEKETTRQEGDKTITEKVKVTEPCPQFFCFKKPSRDEREEADAYRAENLTRFIERGIISEAVLRMKFSGTGGALSEEQNERWVKSKMDLLEKMRQYQLLHSIQKTEEAIALSKEIVKLRDEVIAIQAAQSILLDGTAEARARNKLTQYLALMFTYTRDSAEKPWVPYFSGDTIEKKFAALDAFDESEDAVFPKVWSRVELLSVLYISAGGAITKDEIDAFDKEFNTAPAPVATEPAANVG